MESQNALNKKLGIFDFIGSDTVQDLQKRAGMEAAFFQCFGETSELSSRGTETL